MRETFLFVEAPAPVPALGASSTQPVRIAAEAASLVEVDYTPLDAVIDPAAGTAPCVKAYTLVDLSGSYTIPQGNLFPPGTARTRPEIFTMGNRNPWRVSVDSETGAIHWGEIGPAAGQDSSGIGPRGPSQLRLRMIASSSFDIRETSLPSSTYWPLVGRSRQPRMCMSVDLPEPEGPMIAVKLPRVSAMSTPRSASTAEAPSPKRRVTAVARTTTSGAAALRAGDVTGAGVAV